MDMKELYNKADYKDELGMCFKGDCLEVMKKIPDKSVDLIITSPPYNLGKTHHTRGNVFKAYNEYDDNMPENLYQKWQIEVLNECYRILKDDGSMWYNHKNRIRNGIQISPYEWLYKTDFIIKQEIVWHNGSPNFDKCRFYPQTERIYWLTKNAKTKMFNTISHNDIFTMSEWKAQGTKGEFKRAFPVEMPQDIIQCFDNAKIILDPFMGSGSTGVACKNTNRRYIGIELDDKYFDIGVNRLKEK